MAMDSKWEKRNRVGMLFKLGSDIDHRDLDLRHLGNDLSFMPFVKFGTALISAETGQVHELHFAAGLCHSLFRFCDHGCEIVHINWRYRFLVMAEVQQAFSQRLQRDKPHQEMLRSL